VLKIDGFFLKRYRFDFIPGDQLAIKDYFSSEAEIPEERVGLV